jgi:hypothetical protein
MFHDHKTRWTGAMTGKTIMFLNLGQPAAACRLQIRMAYAENQEVIC